MMSFVQKYPAIPPAFEYVGDYAEKSYFDPNLCMRIARMQLRACQLIEENVDRPETEKNILMAGVILSFVNPGFLAENKPENLGPAVNKTIDDLLAYKKTSAEKSSIDVSQIMIASSTAIAEDIMERMQSGKLSPGQAASLSYLGEAPKSYARDAIGLSATRLLTAYETTGKKLAQEIQKRRKPGNQPRF